jgi:hypothetical protein
MNKKFLQSVVIGIAGLTLAASCSSHSKTESNTCGAKNGCAAKKDEANKCSSKKDEVNNSSKKNEVTKEETKTVKKAKKAKVVKSTETKTEEKSN